MESRQKFDDIFQQLTFGVKATKNVYRPVGDENKLPLRQLPKEDPPAKKRRKPNPGKSGAESSEGIKLFSDSTTTIEAATKNNDEKSAGLTPEQRVAKIRQLNQIYSWGAETPDPFIHFKDLDLPTQLLTNIKEAHFHEPTPIQMEAIPIMFNNQNLLANAPTGSGKTLAFVLPVIKSFLDRPCKKNRVHAVILSPTNVLAQQIYVQFLKFAENVPIRIALLEPGTPIDDADVLVATPHKFIYSLKKENLTNKNVSRLRWLILDEADRLFESTEDNDRNFRLQFDEVYKACKGPKTKLAFFSATFSFELEEWCKKELDDPAMLCVGHRNSANSAVKQELRFTSDETGKLFALEQLLTEGFEPPALIFLQSKERAGTLFVELQARCPNIPIRLISSELTNDARDKILDKFRSGQVWVLISTEMLGRGLDMNVNLVVNFDLPTSIISYVHRVGRSGRAGRQGRAVTFFTYDDMQFIRPIATVINRAGFDVPEYTLNLEKLNKKQRKFLLKHAPKRRNVGSVGRWNRVKKSAMKERVIKRDPALLRKKKKKSKVKNDNSSDNADKSESTKVKKMEVGSVESKKPKKSEFNGAVLKKSKKASVKPKFVEKLKKKKPESD